MSQPGERGLSTSNLNIGDAQWTDPADPADPAVHADYAEHADYAVSIVPEL